MSSSSFRKIGETKGDAEEDIMSLKAVKRLKNTLRRLSLYEGFGPDTRFP